MAGNYNPSTIEAKAALKIRVPCTTQYDPISKSQKYATMTALMLIQTIHVKEKKKKIPKGCP